jgi:hypothetical protein
MGSEKSADQAWDLVLSWFVIGGRFYRAASDQLEAGVQPVLRKPAAMPLIEM